MRWHCALLAVFFSWAWCQTQATADSSHIAKSGVEASLTADSLEKYTLLPASDTIVPARLRAVSLASAGVYVAALLGFHSAWYKNYDRAPFHLYDDSRNWLQMDKLGHLYGNYFQSSIMIDFFRWSGLPRDKAILIGGLSGIAFQSVIEVLDGTSAEWGFSWSDMAANTAGALLAMSQEYYWDAQRMVIKFSAHRAQYTGPELERSNALYGSSLPSRILKDYNAQTYWLSINPSSFMKANNRFPSWLNLALGMGADGMYGGSSNSWYDQDQNLQYIPSARYRQWYLSPDIDFTRIPTRHRGLQFAFSLLNIVKLPLPTLEYNSQQGFRFHALYF